MFYLLLLTLIFLNFLYFLYYDQISNNLKLIDTPDSDRKMHSRPIPRSGGFFFLISIVALIISDIFFTQMQISRTIFIDSFSEVLSFYLLFLIIFLIGIYDDRYNLNANKKIVYSSVFILFFLLLDPSLIINELRFSFTEYTLRIDRIGVFFTLLCFILLLNALNMFDGINLQLSLYVGILFIFLYINSIASLFILLMLTPTCFFIYLNFLGKIFLGDGGSLSLAFIIGYVIIKSYNLGNNYFYCDQIFILFLIPGLDMLRVSIERLFSGVSMFNADKNHIHHLLFNKYGYIKSITFMHSILIFSLIQIHFMVNSVYTILIISFIYLLLIFHLKKSK